MKFETNGSQVVDGSMSETLAGTTFPVSGCIWADSFGSKTESSSPQICGLHLVMQTFLSGLLAIVAEA